GSRTISIFLQPPGVIALGGSTTICCSCQCGRGKFVLYKNGLKLHELEPLGGRAEFSISNATESDRGSYSCHYLNGAKEEARSESVEVWVEEFRLHKPVLSILPGREVNAGAYVTLHCVTGDASASCYLYLEGQANVFKFLPRGQDNVNLSDVRAGNGGRYRCQCYTGLIGSFEWSPSSDALELVVR
ncbi:IGSF1 protein, partial [Centropus unirufus]|nr:IGSF1 protein [Centropus unirufus]